MNMPPTEQLICQDCGKQFPRGKSRGYRAKYCPDCRGKHSGRPAKVSALPSPPPDEQWWDDSEVTRSELHTLTRKQMKALLLEPSTPLETRMQLYRVIGRWDDDNTGNEKQKEEIERLRIATTGRRDND